VSYTYDAPFKGAPSSVSTAAEAEFWATAHAINEAIPKLIEQELAAIPSRFHFFEMLRPITGRQMHLVMRILNASKMTNRPSHFALSNLGNIVFSDSALFRVKDLRLYVHSFKARALGWITYTFNGGTRFCCVSNEKCMTPSQVNALERAFMILLEQNVMQPADRTGKLHEAQVSRS
jgi:hypothetical protein